MILLWKQRSVMSARFILIPLLTISGFKCQKFKLSVFLRINCTTKGHEIFVDYIKPFKKMLLIPPSKWTLLPPVNADRPVRWQERWAERKRWKTGRERERALGRREEASQTDCLAAPGSPALSVIWFPGQRLSSLMNIGTVSHLPHKRKGSCFHSAGLESLFQESILPTPDCKPVSMQRSYVHKYYPFSFFSFF